MSWDLLLHRTDLTAATLVELPDPEPGTGQVLLRTSLVGVTANNVTYALFGDAMHYWDFFPASPGFGRVPLWGFADVVASRAAGVEQGARYYGYLPPSQTLLVVPDRVDGRGFRDAVPHRAALPSPYNSYALTSSDPAYAPDTEALQVLYRPLFTTSFVLADFLGSLDVDAYVLSSASSKTAYGTAALLQGERAVVGLTSEANLEFTESLGVYDAVLTYDDVEALPPLPTAYVDLAGSAAVRTAVHEQLQEHLVHDAVIGASHQDGATTGPLPGARPTFFFAPDRIRELVGTWGADGFEERFGAAWEAFVPQVTSWVDVVRSSGPDGLRDAWLEVLAGRAAPRTGHVVEL